MDVRREICSDFIEKNFMIPVFAKAFQSLRADGIGYTIYKCLRYPLVKLKSFKNRRRIFASDDPIQIFTKIYETNWWGSKESISGQGSTLAYTENLRRELPNLFQRFAIKTVFDAPCGDFNWMNKVVESNDIRYVGGDIVPQLIMNNRATFANERVSFLQVNVINDSFPSADLWICRDCLIHFSYLDIYRTLQNFIASGIPYILTTSHINVSGFSNADIVTGDARLLDLISAPFFFPVEARFRIKDWVKPHPPREMLLFDRDQVIQAVSKMKAALGL